MAWTPQPNGLQEILQTIHESTDSQNTDLQRNITHVLLLIGVSYGRINIFFAEIELIHTRAGLHCLSLLYFGRVAT
jgi:hypothetical protein